MSSAWLRKYTNERLTGDANRAWFKVIPDYGECQVGCVLGAGQGDMEKQLLARQHGLHLTIYDISGEASPDCTGSLSKSFPGGRRCARSDLPP